MWIARGSWIGIVRLAAPLCLVAATATPAQDFLAFGAEFQVNSSTVAYQGHSDVGVATSGGFVVTWESNTQSPFGIFARRFDAAGGALGGELQINASTVASHRPHVGLSGGGSFVVSWTTAVDASTFGVVARRFDSFGAALTDEIPVSSHQSFSRNAVATNGFGDFVVVWEGQGGEDGSGDGIFGRRFDASGTAQGSVFLINGFTAGNQLRPAVAMTPLGSFVVAWESFHDGALGSVFAQRFDAAGVAQGAELQVNTHTIGEQSNASVASDAAGNFVVAWQSAQDGDVVGIFARRFDSSGSGLAGEFQVNTYTVGAQGLPRVGMHDDGFVIAWLSSDQDGGADGVFARRFDAAGAPLGAEFQVTTYTTGNQINPAVAMNKTGDTVVTWQSSGQDGDSHGIFAQRYGTLAVLDIDGNGATAALSDGLLVLRYLFGLGGQALVGSAVANGCTRCTAEEIEAYLATLI
jgi:hypothetical protein